MCTAARNVDGNICYVVNEAGPTSVPLDLAVALDRYENISVDLISWYGADEDSGSRGVNFVSLDQEQRFSVSGVRQLRKVLRRYDLIQIHHHLTGFLTRVLFGMSDSPIVARVGNVREGFSFVGRNLNSITFPLCDTVVCNSQSVYDSLWDVEKRFAGRDKFQIVSNGFDPVTVEQSLNRSSELINQIRTDQLLISNASVMTEQKALKVLLRAIATIRPHVDSRIKVVLAGDGPTCSELKALASRLNLDDIVTFPGLLERYEVHQLMDMSDIYVMPSRWEGFSAASLEAMGIGTACVFSDIAPFVQPFEGHALFHQVDDSDALAAQISKLVKDDGLRADLAEQAKEHVRTSYHMSDTARMYARVYSELLKR